MTEFKTTNDGYCSRCGVNTTLYDLSDYRVGRDKSKWLCPKCLKSHYKVDVIHDKDEMEHFNRSV